MSLGKFILAISSFFFSVFSTAQTSGGLDDFPVKAFPASKKQDILLIYFTGDGGWNNFSQDLVGKIKSEDYPIVVFDSRKYFWSAKTPDKFAADVELIMDYYMDSWKINKVVVVGYSFGADAAAFLPTRLKPKAASHLISMVLLSPSYSSDFEVKLADLIGSSTRVERKYNVQEVLTNCTMPVMCIFGEDEDLYLKESLIKSGKVKVREIPGSHRYDNNVELLTKLILGTLK